MPRERDAAVHLICACVCIPIAGPRARAVLSIHCLIRKGYCCLVLCASQGNLVPCTTQACSPLFLLVASFLPPAPSSSSSTSFTFFHLFSGSVCHWLVHLGQKQQSQKASGGRARPPTEPIIALNFFCGQAIDLSIGRPNHESPPPPPPPLESDSLKSIL